MAIRTADTIRSAFGELLDGEGFAIKGKWPRWSLERSIGGHTDKVELLCEPLPGQDRDLRRMNVNFAVRHPRTGRDVWMNRPGEEWFEYGDEARLREELNSCLSRIFVEVLPWMERMRSELG
ncbi:hypothetical protein CDO73_19590 [Saccharibacillus sp. O23]|uniref:hypothetical protein n=1 Tax=Saccharibacillus sp. O23 TaxID=2009338 RepID=UPI000B4E1C26|nr:hypothetical protein [Saccharibacillus sp. O23]OWR28091.1 hypothetical protein CDO73_19590 [Saccharibacillus sp. O23]